MNYQLDYFYGKEAEQYNFYRIPKLLFTDKRFEKVSIEAKVLYGLLLDRMSLSIKNKWVDDENRVYIYFIHHFHHCGKHLGKAVFGKPAVHKRCRKRMAFVCGKFFSAAFDSMCGKFICGLSVCIRLVY